MPSDRSSRMPFAVRYSPLRSSKFGRSAPSEHAPAMASVPSADCVRPRPPLGGRPAQGPATMARNRAVHCCSLISQQGLHPLLTLSRSRHPFPHCELEGCEQRGGDKVAGARRESASPYVPSLIKRRGGGEQLEAKAANWEPGVARKWKAQDA